MPRNRLTLAIGVSRENQAVGCLGRVGNGADLLLLVAIELPVHLEALVGPDGPVLGRQVADMTVRGEDLVVLAQILLDGFGLGRGFDNDELHL